MSPADDERDEQAARPDEGLGFVQRWSRRKQAAARGEPVAPLAPEQQAEETPETSDGPAVEAQQAGAEADVYPEPADAEPEPPGDEDMPPLESIDQGGSVAAFFSSRVSAGLRRAALRRLFSQPEFSGEDLLDDYARDYTQRAPLGDIVTADMRYRAEQARKLAERKLKAALEAETRPDSRPALAREDGSESPSEETAAAERAREESTEDGARQWADADSNADAEAASDEPDHESKPT